MLKTWHIDLGLSTTSFGNQLERALRGIKRLRGVKQAKAKMPITLPILRRLLSHLPQLFTGRNFLALRAAFTLAFACFLRSGEVTFEKFDPSYHLTVGSVEFAPDNSHAIVNLPASKTDPFRLGVKVVAPRVDHEECAVTALRAITFGRQPHQPLFCLAHNRPLTRAFFISALRKCLTAAGVSDVDFSGHSFRRGAATWARSQGVPEETIQLLGRWTSSCVRRYVDRSASDRSQLASQLYRNRDAPAQIDRNAWRTF